MLGRIGVGAKFDLRAVREAAHSYKHKALVLRQIHSDKLTWATRANFGFTILIITATVVFTFAAVVGIPTVHEMLFSAFEEKQIEFANNVIIVMIVLLSIAQLIFNYPEKISTHLNSVKRLTEFMVDLDDILLIRHCSERDCERLIEHMHSNYVCILQVLPESSDADWRQAKKKQENKDKLREEQRRADVTP